MRADSQGKHYYIQRQEEKQDLTLLHQLGAPEDAQQRPEWVLALVRKRVKQGWEWVE